MIRYALSIALLVSIIPCCADDFVCIKNPVLAGNTVSIINTTDRERILKIDYGYLNNAKIPHDLKLQVDGRFLFSDSKVGDTLTIDSGTVDLKHIDAHKLIVKGGAIAYLDKATCNIPNITIDANATVYLTSSDVCAPVDVVLSDTSSANADSGSSSEATE